MDEDEKLWNIICNATTGADFKSSKLFCVIDGLDECYQEPRLAFIKLIVSTFSNSDTTHQPHQPPSFLITSRPCPIIEQGFRHLSRIRLRLEDETPAISKDIETMITDRMQSLNPRRFPSKVQQYLHAEVSRKAGRTFLWVKLIFDALEQLDSTTMEEVRKLLDTNPSELNTLYDTSLSGTPNKERTRRLLQNLIAATRPLKLSELNVALQIKETCMYFEDIDLEPDIEDAIKRLCGSVLCINDSTIDFMHQTAKEFLTTYPRWTMSKSQNLIWGGSINVAQSHAILGSICLWYLSLTDWQEKRVVWSGRNFNIESYGERSRCYGCLNTTVGSGDQCEGDHRLDAAFFVRKESWNIQAETEKSFYFYDYAGRNWSHHSEEVLQKVRMVREAGFEPHPDFRQLEASLTSLREYGMRIIRCCTSTGNDPFLFLKEEGFHSVVNWFLNGPRIEDYPDDLILEVICEALAQKKSAFIWPLLQYATTTITNSEWYSQKEKNEMFSRVANGAAAQCLIPVIDHLQQKAEITFEQSDLNRGIYVAAEHSDCFGMAKLIEWGAKDESAESLLASLRHSSCNHQIHSLLFRTQDYRNTPWEFTRIFPGMFAKYRFDQGNQLGAERTETFERFLGYVLNMPLEYYLYAVLEAIRWHHPSVRFLIRSRMDLACAIKGDVELEQEDEPRTKAHCLLQQSFSVACRYGSPAALLIFEDFYPAIDVNRADEFGITPLLAAILAGDYSLCKWLLQKNVNADVCVLHEYKGCPLYEEISAWTLHLTKHSKKLHPYSSFTSTATGTDHSRDWKWTVCSPNIPEIWSRYGLVSFECYPLVEALQVQNLQIFKLLLKYGDPWQDYETGTSVLAAAAAHSEEFFDQFVGFIRTTKNIDSFEIDRAEVPSRRTLLNLAANNGFWNSVVKLISDKSTLDVEAALHVIASFPPIPGRVKMFKKLVDEHNASANTANNDGQTPLDLLEKSISDFDIRRQNEDHVQAYYFLQLLKKEPSYFPSIRRMPRER